MFFYFLDWLHVPKRPCFLQEQCGVAPLTGKELCPFAPGGTWHDALCARITPWDETCTAEQSMWDLPGISLPGENQHYLQALSVMSYP